MTDDEPLGTVVAAASVRQPTGPRRTLEPWADVEGGGCCDVCGNPKTRAYRHPNPLRSGVVLYRCARHRYPTSVKDNPKAAPGGGIYR